MEDFLHILVITAKNMTKKETNMVIYDINSYSAASGRVIKEDGKALNLAESFFKDNLDRIYLKNLTYIQSMSRAAEIFTFSKRKSVPASGFHRLCLAARNGKDLCVLISYSSEDFCLFNTYADVSSITGGIVVTPFSRTIGAPNTLESLITYDPSSFIGGIKRGDDFIGASGATSARAGGSAGSELETIIKSGHNLMIEIQRTETGSKYTGIIVHLYEI